MKKTLLSILIIACFLGILTIPSDSQIPGTQVPIWGNATKLIDTTNEEFGVAHTAGVLQTIVNSSALPSGASTEAKQDDSIDQLVLAVTGLTDLLTELKLKADLDERQLVDTLMKTGDSTYQTPRLDSITHAQTTIDYAHHEIHDGNAYEYSNALDFTNAETKSFLLTTEDSTAWAHFIFEIEAESEFNVDFYEGATPDTVGSAVTAPAVINKDRNSNNEAGMTLTSPTLGAGAKGTLIRRHHGGSGKKAGGGSRGAIEIILAQDTAYWVDITNVSTSNNFIAWMIEWYEHTNK